MSVCEQLFVVVVVVVVRLGHAGWRERFFSSSCSPPMLQCNNPLLMIQNQRRALARWMPGFVSSNICTCFGSVAQTRVHNQQTLRLLSGRMHSSWNNRPPREHHSLAVCAMNSCLSVCRSGFGYFEYGVPFCNGQIITSKSKPKNKQ